MKIFTKTALACAMAAGAVMASAETVEIRDANGDLLVTYSSNSVVVEGGVVTLNNGVYVEGTIPGTGGEGFICDPNTTVEDNGVCIGTSGGGANCGPGTELDETEEQCVPATPATLNITSSPSTLGDGVTSATVTFQFSRPVTGFTQSDISVSPTSHTLSNFSSVDGDTYRVTLNRSGNNSGTVTVAVSNGAYMGDNGVDGLGRSRSISLEGGTIDIGGECEGYQIPNNVNLGSNPEVATFGLPQGQIEFLMPRYPGVTSAGFETPSSSASGQIDLGGITQTSTHIRRMWISDCPGGDPVSPRCEAEGNLLTMRWVVGYSRTSCRLNENSTYYFNLSSSSCDSSSGCGAYIQQLGGW